MNTNTIKRRWLDASVVMLFLLLAGAFITKQVVDINTDAQSSEVATLRFTAPVGMDAPHFVALKAWAEKLELESGGRLSIAFDENAKSKAALGLLRSGGTDITLAVPPWDLETFGFWHEQSGRSNGNAAATVEALWRASVCQKYPKSRILALTVTENNVVHSMKPGLEGLTFRTMNPTLDARMQKLGALPKDVPNQPDVLPMMTSGVLDSYVTSWTVAENLGLTDVAQYHTVIPGLSTLILMVLISEDAYDALPEDLQQTLRANSGLKLSLEMLNEVRRSELTALQDAIAKGHEVTVLPALNAIGPVVGCTSAG